MEQANTRKDPISALLDQSGPSATIQKDKNGNDRVVFTPEERERFRRYCAEELRDGIEASKERWASTRERIRVYEAKAKDGETSGTIIPIAKRNANQIIAYIVQQILGRTPIASARPQDFGDMDVIFPGPDGPVLDTASIEEVAAGLEDILQDILESRIDFRGALTEFTTDVVIGAGIPMLKWCYEKVEGTALVPDARPDSAVGRGKDGKAKRKVVIVPYPKEVPVIKGCPHKVLAVSDLNLVYPADTLDIQSTPWMAERLPRLDAMALWEKIQGGVYDFGLADGEEPTPAMIQAVVSGSPADPSDAPQPDPAKDDQKYSRDYQDAFELYVFWPIRNEKGQIKIESLVCDFHLGAQEIMAVKRLPYAHKMRPYTPGFYRKVPHEFRSGSVVEDMEPFQDMASSIYRLEIQNAVQAALKGYVVRRGSPAHQDLMRKKAAGGMRPGDFIEAADPQTELIPFQTGGTNASLFPILNMTLAEADRVVNLSETDRGDVPNRTAAATVAKVHEQSTMQRAMALEAVRSSLSLGFYMMLENIRQYAPAGETLATYDPRKRAMQERAISMPKDAINEKFRIVVNATSQDQTKEAERERLMIDYNMINGANELLLKNAATLFHPETTPAYERLLAFALQRSEDSLLRLLAIHRNDAEAATLDKMEIEELLQAKREALAPPEEMMGGGEQPMEGGEMPMEEGMMSPEGQMMPPMPGGPPMGAPPMPPMPPMQGPPQEMMNGAVPQAGLLAPGL